MNINTSFHPRCSSGTVLALIALSVAGLSGSLARAADGERMMYFQPDGKWLSQEQKLATFPVENLFTGTMTIKGGALLPDKTYFNASALAWSGERWVSCQIDDGGFRDTHHEDVVTYANIPRGVYRLDFNGMMDHKRVACGFFTFDDTHKDLIVTLVTDHIHGTIAGFDAQPAAPQVSFGVSTAPLTPDEKGIALVDADLLGLAGQPVCIHWTPAVVADLAKTANVPLPVFEVEIPPAAFAHVDVKLPKLAETTRVSVHVAIDATEGFEVWQVKKLEVVLMSKDGKLAARSLLQNGDCTFFNLPSGTYRASIAGMESFRYKLDGGDHDVVVDPKHPATVKLSCICETRTPPAAPVEHKADF